MYCDGDLSFQKRYEKCYHTAVDDYKKTSLTVFFILFCNGFITFSASKIWKEAKLLKSDVFKSTRYKSKWASGIFEQWQKEGLIRVINIQIKKGVHWSLMLYQTQGFDVF